MRHGYWVERVRQGNWPQQLRRRRERGPDPAATNDLRQGPPGPFSFAGDALAANVGAWPDRLGQSAVDTTGGSR